MLAAVTSFRPDVLLVDKHPLGIQEELVPALDEQRRHGRSCVLGLREILDEPDVVRREWSLYGLPERIADYHDRVLVYGHPHVFDPVEAYAFPPTVTPRVRYCGIVLNQDGVTARKEDLQTRRGHVRPTVLATVGGGEDGKQILETFIAACVGAPWDGIVVAGTMMQPSDRESLARIASEANIEFHVFVSGLSEWYERVDAVVCMGGYNTLAEALHKSVPTVCIPRIYPRKEQLMRATALADLGLLRMLDPSQLSVAALREAISIALVQPRDQLEQRINAVLDFTGADRVAVELLDLVGTKFGEAVMSGDATVG
jgi:predicted glycosyltransferase